jgi:L-lactate dehydrogenase complex protein LldF
VKINIPHMLIGLRELQHHEPKRGGFWERLAYRLAREIFSRPWLYRLVLRLSRFLLRFRARDGWLSSMPGAGAAWTAHRDFPAPAPRSFRDRWRDLTQT